jgi:uncharacterized protein DUF3768
MSDCSSAKTARIRELNDQLRRKAIGGRVVITRGIEVLGAAGISEVLTAVVRFDDFTEDNDPWGEHDCAILTVNARPVLFKIDYYDLGLRWHSPDASDPAATQRVMTIMLAEEY